MHPRLSTNPTIRASGVSVRTPVPRSVWQRLHDQDIDALPTQSPRWVDCLVETGRYRDASRLYEMPDGRLAILPLVSPAMAWPSALTHSMPASWGYGGVIAPQGFDEVLAAAVLSDLSTSASRIHLRPNPLHAPVWAAVAGHGGMPTAPSRAHIVDLDGGFETVWRDRFKSAVRREVRRAEEAEVVVATDTTGELIPVFYDLLLRSFDRWADRQHEPRWLAQIRGRRRDSLQKFRTIARVMGDQCQLSVAWYRDRPVAAIVVLRGGANAHYTRGAMDTAIEVPVKVTSLLHKTAIEAACRDGCRRYHMGDSGGSAGLAQFKTRFGAQPYDFAEYWIERLPLHRAHRAIRGGVKRTIGFRDD